MNHGSLFSGIGGFDLAADRMGWDNVLHCEINEFGRKILNHYWPKAISYDDITKTDFTIHTGQIDILTGGFPCQPYSQAGKRKGKEDSRHLWPEMLRAIREIQPTWVVGENVRGLTNWNGGMVFDEVQAELEAEGYEVLPFLLPACAINAPHRRDRIWFIAYCASKQSERVQFEQREFSEQEQREFRRNNSKMGNRYATNPDHNGCERINGKHEVNTSEGRFNALNDFEPNDTENTESDGCLFGESEKGQPKVGGFGNTGTGNNERICSENRVVADTNKPGRREKRITSSEPSKPERQYSKTNSFNQFRGWENFPTQSPICSGDDGFSGKLDGITFPKWRNESIKSYGNAIVPQVAFEIFKAIEKYNLQ
jgi:DNA (cytosine-5)-methyltransferase 1